MNNTKIIYKNIYKKHWHILEVISIKNKQPNINKIALNTGTNILSIFSN